MGSSKPIPEDEWERTVTALKDHNWNVRATCRATGIKRSTLRHRVDVLKAQKRIPNSPNPDDGYKVKGTSTLYDKDGNVTLTWVKTDIDRERQEQLVRETIAALVEDIPPCLPTPTPKISDSDLCVAFVIGDAHLGLYTWGAEAADGESFDLAIAQADIIAAADRLVASAPEANECLVVQLGDFYHMDSSENTTAKGTRQDVDTRFPKVIRAGIHTMRHMIDCARKKYKIVRVRNAGGNHDPHAYIILVEALRGYYSNEPRVIIEDSPRALWTYRFGLNLIGVTHGHTMKPEDLPGVMAVDARADWGVCEFFHILTGHVHHRRMVERMGTVVESFRTLAAKDAWHLEQGYRSGREMQSIVYHRDYGEIERHTAGIKRVRSCQTQNTQNRVH